MWNLTVDGEHEYYASGVLVKNCDCLSYGSTYVDRFAGAMEDPRQESARTRERDQSEEQARHDAWLSPENPAMWPDEFDD